MNAKVQFQGVYTALITPMLKGEVNWNDLTKLIERQVASGVHGLVPVGTTGESPTLNGREHIKVIEKVVEIVNGRIPVIAGTGANCTTEAVELTQEAEKAGADAFLQVAPYYNKPSQEGVYAHFSKIAEKTDKPIVLYSIPSRCGIDISVETVLRLAKNFPHVRTIKEAGGATQRVIDLKAICGDIVTVLSGDDGLTVDFIKAGGTGVISVASNYRPDIMLKLTQAALQRDWETANRIQQEYLPLLTDVVFMEGNPVSIKEAMYIEGLIESAEMRLPLVRMSLENQSKMKSILQQLKG